jgi:hypothetical protein
MSTPPLQFSPSGRLEFEHIELESMMRKEEALMQGRPPTDDKTDRDLLSINFGHARDRVPGATERMLGGAAIDWMLAFPASARPKALCERFPHVANRLAAGWTDGALSTQALQQLVDDLRWGGVGFPAQVQGELRQLLLLQR